VSAEGGRLRGPMPLSDEWICVVAGPYVLGFMTKPQAPLQGAVAALSEGYSYATVREHVQRARDKGFLASTKPGQARLELGPRWREVIGLLHECLPAEIRTVARTLGWRIGCSRCSKWSSVAQTRRPRANL
jgi:hypothetical protein